MVRKVAGYGAAWEAAGGNYRLSMVNANSILAQLLKIATVDEQITKLYRTLCSQEITPGRVQELARKYNIDLRK